MGGSTASWVGLIRAIGPATHKKMPMQQLRDGCAAAGLEDVTTYIASGNVLFRSSRSAADIKKTLTGIIRDHDLENDVFLRQPHELEAVLAQNPFPDAATARPNHLLMVFLEAAPSEEQRADLLRHPGLELIGAAGREIFIDYVEGVARSKLTPTLIERRLKQPGTARNINTVRKLFELSRAS